MLSLGLSLVLVLGLLMVIFRPLQRGLLAVLPLLFSMGSVFGFASNAAVVGIAFLALLFSGFVPTVTIGWMISLTMLISCLSTLALIPALLTVLRPRFLLLASPLEPA